MMTMPPKRKSLKPRPYSRQAMGKTIKCIVMDLGVAEWAENEAKLAGKSFSSFIAGLLRSTR